MPRRKHLTRIPVWLPDDQRVVYFITACCYQHRLVFADAKNVSIALDALIDCAIKIQWHIHYACFMPDHVHVLLSPRQERQQRLSVFINRWKSSATKRLHTIGMTGNIWQPEFFDRLLRADESLTDKWKYIRMNPVRKGLCKEPDDYPFCGTSDEIRVKLYGLPIG